MKGTRDARGGEGPKAGHVDGRNENLCELSHDGGPRGAVEPGESLKFISIPQNNPI
jgi:hypothetical protein